MARMVDGGGDLSDRELGERAIVLLKQTPLFRHMSWRLLGDLVTIEGLRVAHDATERIQLNFAVLVVLEGTLIVGLSSSNHPPLDSPIPPPPIVEDVVELGPGVYLKNNPALPEVLVGDHRTIEAPRKQAFRFYALRSETLHQVPTQVLAGMDPGAIGGNLEVLL
jgi:hypothetical protein